MIQNGSGTLTLTGTSTYTGATTINTGRTLSLGSGGDISSSSGVNLAGTGATLDTSGTGGTAQIHNLTGVAGTVVNLGTTSALEVITTPSTNTTFGGVIQGAGPVEFSGGGTMTLTGVNTHTGFTEIQGTTLALSGSGSIASSSGVQLDNGASSFDISQTNSGASVRGLRAGSGTPTTVTLGGKTLTITGTTGGSGFNGTIQGSGGVVIGNGTDVANQLFDGGNTYSGGTTINSNGTLRVLADHGLGDASGGLTFNGGTLEAQVGFTSNRAISLTTAGTTSGGTFDVLNGETLTLGGVVSGAGGLTKIDTGTLTLTNAGNSYTGTTTVNAGTLALSGAGSIAASSGVTFNGGTFDISATTSGASVKGLSSTGGAGTVALGAQTLTITGTGASFSGVIGGTGGLTIGDGTTGATQRLSNANTYSGTTTLNTGSTLFLSGGGTLTGGSTVSFGGTGATLDISGVTSQASVGVLSSAGGVGTVKLGSKTLDITNGGSTFSGAIRGSGGLTVGAFASQTLSGINTYTGATTIDNGGTLGLSGSGSIAASRGVNLAGTSATFDISGASGAVTIKDLSGIAGTTVALGANTLTAGTAHSTSFAGSIGGTGGFTKQGGGTLTLTGVNGYGGATTVNVGTLAIDSATALSGATDVTVAAGATLTITDNASQATANSLAGGGTVKIGPTTGAGSLILQGNTATTFSGSFAGKGSLFLANGNLLTLTGTGGSSGKIGGDLELDSTGSGGLTLSGTALTVLGQVEGVTVEGGTLTVSNGGKLTVGPSAEGNLAVEGTMLISGAGSTVTDYGATNIGSFGAGSLNISGGGRLNSLSGAGIDAGFGTSVATVSGTGSTWAITGNLEVGGGFSGAAGVLSITSGGRVTVSGSAQVGDFFDGSSLTTVSGTGSSLAVTGGLRVGSTDDSSHGTLTVDDGGSVTAASVLVGVGSTLNLGTGGLAGSIVTPTLLDDGAIVANFTNTLTVSANISGSGTLTKQGTGTLTLSGSNTYSGGTTINAGTLSVSADSNLGAAGGRLTFGGGTLETTASFTGSRGVTLNTGGGTLSPDTGTTLTLTGVIGGSGRLTMGGQGTVILAHAETYTGGTSVGGGILQLGIAGGAAGSIKGAVSTDVIGGALEIVNSNTSGITSITNTLGITRFRNATTAGGMTILNLDGGTEFHDTSSAGTANITNSGTGFLTFFDSSTAGHAAITNSFSLVFLGNSTAGHATINTLSGGRTTFIGSASGGHAAFTTAAGGTFDISGLSGGTPGMTAGSIAGAGSWVLGGKKLTVGSLNTDTTVSGVISGSGGSLVKVGTGTLTLSGANTYTGATEVAAGGLFLTGSLTSNLTVDTGASFGGPGTLVGNLTVNGNIRPDIGTTNVVGIYTQAAGSSYTVEVTPGGLSDKINVTGNAVINNTSAVAVMADVGTYKRQTTYTILTASTGVNGKYGSVTSNFAFLTPTLSYDANDVFLTLLQTDSAFAAGGVTSNQKSVGQALDKANATATGDFNTVLNALSLLSTAQAPGALDTISGVNYAGFGTLAVQNAIAFMNAFGQQAGHGGGGSGHIALVAPANDACEFSCDTPPEQRWGVWGGGLGGVGTVAGDASSHGSTYNLGGFAAGLDYKFDPQFTAGVTLGYSSATLWTSGMPGQGTSDQVQMGLYGQFTQGALYVDGLAGYAHGQNRMTRPIAIPGLAMRTALGSTTVDQFFGLVETGYKVAIDSNAYVTPFARLQGSTATQAGFSETGADSLDLNVAAQTTNSLRTVLGTQVGWTMAGVDVKLQAGWSHEFADTSRPVTASFAGAPAFGFTTPGAAAPRDGAVIGLQAEDKIADSTNLYARYDGELQGGTTSHTFSAGVRMTW